MSGSACVGKSKLIEAITQTIIRHYNNIAGNNPDDIKVLLCAYTGKAAYNIHGITLHSTFYLPVNNEIMNRLPPVVLSNLAAKLYYLKFLIIDEISVVGRRDLIKLMHDFKKYFIQKNCLEEYQ